MQKAKLHFHPMHGPVCTEHKDKHWTRLVVETSDTVKFYERVSEVFNALGFSNAPLERSNHFRHVGV